MGGRTLKGFGGWGEGAEGGWDDDAEGVWGWGEGDSFVKCSFSLMIFVLIFQDYSLLLEFVHKHVLKNDGISTSL
jgi:hypothetical protein